MYKIQIARTKKEKEEIYKFRYKIYIEEMNRSTKADHKNKKIIDYLDDFGTLIYAKQGDQVIACVRVNLAKYGSIEFENEYDIKKFHPYFPENISTSTKLMVGGKYRKTLVTAKICIFAFKYQIEQNVIFDFININEHLYSFYKRLGYRKYKSNFNHPQYGEVIPMVLAVNDFEYLKSIKSVYSRVKINNPFSRNELNYFYSQILKNGHYKNSHVLKDPGKN